MSLFSVFTDATDAHPSRIPILVLTGYLGSGKTTLLNRLLDEPDLRKTAVLINEFGEIGLDHDLVSHQQEQMTLLSNGCLCCTIRGDLKAALRALAQGEPGRIEQVVLETTGLADPAPILHTLMADPEVLARFRLAAVVTVVDAFNAERTLARQAESVKQVAVADVLMLSKTDLVAAESLPGLTARLRDINPMAELLDAQQHALASLLPRFQQARTDASSFDEQGYKRFAFMGGASSAALAQPASTAAHVDGIHTFSITRDEPLHEQGFFTWLDMLASMRGDDLLRVKGIVHIRESPDRPLVIHGVQHLFHPPRWLETWPSEDRRSRLVFITRNVDSEAVETMLDMYQRRRRTGRGLPQER